MDEIKIEGEKEINLERIKHKDWEFLWNDEKMMSSKEMDMISDRMKIHHLPEMLFGHNRFFMVNTNFDFVYEINPLQMLDLANYNERKEKLNSDGLNRIYYSPPDVKVQYYDKWKNMKIERDDIQKLDPVADWSFSSSYMGTVTRLSESKLIEKFDDFDFTKEYPKINIVPSTEKLPVDRLGVDNPILNYMQVNLYDDELCDNGISEGKFRFRVMNDCFFGLLRSYLRIDNVLVRIIDTRIFHSFGDNYILREFQVKESSYEDLIKKGFKFSSEWSLSPSQSDIVGKYMDPKFEISDHIVFSKQTN